MKNLSIFGAVGLLALAGSAYAGTPAIDGTKDAIYGTALALQTVQTQFGDANGNLIGGGGGELDGLYATADGNNLYIMLTGNVETNGNGVFILLDSSAVTGTNVLPNITGSLDDLWAAADSIGGTTLSVGFEPNYGIFWKPFNNPVEYAVTVANFVAATSVSPGNQATGATANPAIGSVITIGAHPGYRFALDNSNSAGVDGGAGAFTNTAAVAAVNTGLEVQIPLAAVGLSPGNSVKILALYTSGSFGGDTFASNQALPPLPTPQGNIGSLSNSANKAKIGTIVPATYTLPNAGIQDWSLF